ncbi:hypothetical protein V8C86DRAFT_3022410 [Haematococcus lacustris]
MAGREGQASTAPSSVLRQLETGGELVEFVVALPHGAPLPASKATRLQARQDVLHSLDVRAYSGASFDQLLVESYKKIASVWVYSDSDSNSVGQGFLLQEGVTLRLDDWVTAGNYTYCLTVAAPAQAAAGAQHLGQSTFRRGITQLKAAVEASNNQLREDVARSNKQHKEDMASIQNELADVRRQMEDGTCIGLQGCTVRQQ